MKGYPVGSNAFFLIILSCYEVHKQAKKGIITGVESENLLGKI